MIIILNAEYDCNPKSLNKKFEDLDITDFSNMVDSSLPWYKANKILLVENSNTEKCKMKYLKHRVLSTKKILPKSYWENVSLCGNEHGIINDRSYV